MRFLPFMDLLLYFLYFPKIRMSFAPAVFDCTVVRFSWCAGAIVYPRGQRAHCPGSMFSRLWPLIVWLGCGCSLVPWFTSHFPLQTWNLKVLWLFFRESGFWVLSVTVTLFIIATFRSPFLHPRFLTCLSLHENVSAQGQVLWAAWSSLEQPLHLVGTCVGRQ